MSAIGGYSVWRRLGFAGCLFSAVLVSIPARGESEVAHPAFAGIPGITYDYYDVTGSTPGEIRRSMNRLRPKDPADDLGYDAVTNWRIDWKWLGVPGKDCVTFAPIVTFSADVLLPRLKDPASLPITLQQRWRKFMDAVELHEAGHARQALSRVTEIKKTMTAIRCDKADAAASAIIADEKDLQRTYDIETRHGATQGAIFP